MTWQQPRQRSTLHLRYQMNPMIFGRYANRSCLGPPNSTRAVFELEMKNFLLRLFKVISFGSGLFCVSAVQLA